LWKFAAADVAAPLPKGNRASHRNPGFRVLPWLRNRFEKLPREGERASESGGRCFTSVHHRLLPDRHHAWRNRQLKPSFNKSGQSCRWRPERTLAATEAASENGRSASWQSSRQNLTPPRQADAFASPVCLPTSAPSGASSTSGHSTPTGRNCIICAGPAPPGAPSKFFATKQGSNRRR
jgi:hypothetical protein